MFTSARYPVTDAAKRDNRRRPPGSPSPLHSKHTLTDARALPPHSPVVPTGKHRPVLYISGDREGRVRFAKIARRWKNVRLVVVESAWTGFQIAMDHRLRLVVMDDPLPGIDAAELVTHLRRRALSSETPIMILAHDSGPCDRARLMWAGASAIHTKPLNVAGVDRTLMVLMEIATLR